MAKKLSKMDLEIASLMHIAAAKKEGAQEVAKQSKSVPEAVDKSAHAAILKMVNAEVASDKAVNAVYTAFKGLITVALPLMNRTAAHAAIMVDIHKTYGEARKSAAIQRITMLNNCRTICYGKAASRDTPAQEPQGAQVVLDALETCTSLPALKQALTLLKSVKHGATGVAKVEPKAKADKAAPSVKGGLVLPDTRKAALAAVVRMLELCARVHLTMKDAELIQEVDKVVKMLKAA